MIALKSDLLVLILLSALIGLGLCKKDCYDKELQQRAHLMDCKLDCSGVVGCDGKTYCNECMANQHGIRVQD